MREPNIPQFQAKPLPPVPSLNRLGVGSEAVSLSLNDAIKRALENNNDIATSRIDVELRERHPIGIARLANALYLVDATGIVIDEYGPNYADLDLPMIDGLAPTPEKAVSVVDESRARLAARLLAAIQRRPDLAQRVSQIDVSDAHDAMVMMQDDTVVLRLGEDDFVDRLQQYLDVAPALREQLPEIDYVDLRFDERVYVRPLKPARPARSGRRAR